MGCPPEQLAEVHSSGTQDGIDHIPFSSFKAVTIHSVFSFEVPDTRFNCGTSFHPAPETSGCSASSGFIDVNFGISSVIVPAISSINEYMKRFFCDAVYLIQGICQRMTVIRVSVNGHGADKPTATAGGCDTYLAAKLIALVGLSLADAFYFGSMDAVDFVLLIFCSLMNPGGNV